MSIKADYFARPFDKFWLLNTGASSLIRPHSPTLPNRSHVHVANNRVVWKNLSEAQKDQRRAANADQRGANAVYGQKYSLKQVDQWALKADKVNEFGVQLSNGRKAIVRIEIREEMMIRSKRKKNMKDKPFRLLSAQLLDPETEEPIYKSKRRMWLGIWGKRRKELTGEEIYWSYRNRFDIEHFLCFGKQRLLLDKFQTPDAEHLDNWMEVASLAYWLLWVSQEQAHPQVLKWQQYDENYKKRVQQELRVSPSEVQRQMERIILSFEQEQFIPKLKIKIKGRQKGQTQPKRKRYKVVWKAKKRKKKSA